jgi:hypothetical protein
MDVVMKRVAAFVAALGLVFTFALRAESRTPWSSYAGTYENRALGIARFTVTVRGGVLYAHQDDQPLIVLAASRPDHFYSRERRASFEFVRREVAVVGVIVTFDRQSIPIFREDASGKPVVTSLDPVYPPPVQLDTATVQSYIGTYKIPNGFTETVWTAGGHVYLQISGRGESEIYPFARDKFYLKTDDGLAVFRRDVTGHVKTLVLEFYGEQYPAAKLR